MATLILKFYFVILFVSCNLANDLLHCADYSLQEVIMGTLTKLVTEESIDLCCQEWFGDFPLKAQTAFLRFGKGYSYPRVSKKPKLPHHFCKHVFYMPI